MLEVSPIRSSILRTPASRLVAALILGSASLVATEAAEPRSKLDPPPLEDYRRWGPLRAQPGIEISNLGYDTNILNSQNTLALGDYTLTVGPRLSGLFLFGRRSFLTFREQFEYTAYLNYSRLNFPNNRFKTRVTLPANNTGVFAEFAIDNVQERPIDLEDLRTRRRDRRAQLGLIFEPGGRTEIELSWLGTDVTYNDPDDSPVDGEEIGFILDRVESGTRLDVAWEMTGRSKLLFDARLDRIDFENPGTVGNVSVDRDGDTWRLTPGIRFGEGGSLLGELKLGWGRYEPRQSGLPVFSDWVGEGELAYRLSWRTRLVLNGRRLPGFSVIPGSPYYLASDVGLRVVHYLTRAVGIEAGATDGTLTFPGRFALAERKDKLRFFDAGVRLRIARGSSGERVEYSIRVRHYDRESTVPGVARSKTMLAMGAVLGF
jgi:hypothetical protein